MCVTLVIYQESLHDARSTEWKNPLVTVAVFILCWSPYFVFDLLQVYGKVPETQTNIAVATFIQSLAPLNSAANPVIYCLFSTRMCNAVRYVPVADSEDRNVIPLHQRNPPWEDNIKCLPFVESWGWLSSSQGTATGSVSKAGRPRRDTHIQAAT